jgi:hypothetical protein
MTRSLAFKPILLLIGFVLVFGGWEAYGQISRQTRLTPAVQQALTQNDRLDIVVRLPFQPEQFHLKLLQEYGTVSSVQTDSISLQRVPAESVRELGKSYWISQIDLAHP